MAPLLSIVPRRTLGKPLNERGGNGIKKKKVVGVLFKSRNTIFGVFCDVAGIKVEFVVE